MLPFFNDHVKEHARPSETSSFENLTRTAQRSIEGNSTDFENLLDQLRVKNFHILFRQDWFVVNRFRWLAKSEHMFPDKERRRNLLKLGEEAMRADDIEKLRQVVAELDSIRVGSTDEDELISSTNIVRS